MPQQRTEIGRYLPFRDEGAQRSIGVRPAAGGQDGRIGDPSGRVDAVTNDGRSEIFISREDFRNDGCRAIHNCPSVARKIRDISIEVGAGQFLTGAARGIEESVAVALLSRMPKAEDLSRGQLETGRLKAVLARRPQEAMGTAADRVSGAAVESHTCMDHTGFACVCEERRDRDTAASGRSLVVEADRQRRAVVACTRLEAPCSGSPTCSLQSLLTCDGAVAPRLLGQSFTEQRATEQAVAHARFGQQSRPGPYQVRPEKPTHHGLRRLKACVRGPGVAGVTPAL